MVTLPANLVYPKAKLRLLDKAYRPSTKIITLNRVNFHSTASQATSQFGYFNAPGRASSHMHLDKAGVWEQYQYLDLRSEADLDGNDATWSVETQGVSNGDEPWTEAQVIALAEFFKWSRQFGIENRLATSSKIGPESRGLSWHRLGIDGSFPALPSIQAGRLQRGGGMHYSTSKGKVCPGYMRIDQIPRIFALSQNAREIGTGEMKLIQSPNRGVAAVGDGWIYGIPTMERVNALVKVWGPYIQLTDAEFEHVAATSSAGDAKAAASSVWGFVIPVASGGNEGSVGPASAIDFMRTVTLNSVIIKKDVKEIPTELPETPDGPTTITPADVAAIAAATAAKTVEAMPKTLS